MVDEERPVDDFPWLRSELSLSLSWFSDRKNIRPIKSVPLFPTGSASEQVKEENSEELADPAGFNWKQNKHLFCGLFSKTARLSPHQKG